MSYYFCIVGTRDNPIYQADLASKPAGSTGPASFFSSSSSSNANTTSTSSINTPNSAITSTTQALPSANSNLNTSTGGVFGFGNALGAITGGLSGTVRSTATGGTTGINTNSTGNPTSTTAGAGSASGTGTGTDGKGLGFGRYNDKHVLQMIAHSSLDVIEDKQFTNQAMYLKAVDRMNEWTTSALIVPGNIKFLILHEHKHDDGIRNFFYDIWELFVKITMNPFHDLNQPIQSASFDAKVRASARKHL